MILRCLSSLAYGAILSDCNILFNSASLSVDKSIFVIVDSLISTDILFAGYKVGEEDNLIIIT